MTVLLPKRLFKALRRMGDMEVPVADITKIS